MRFEETPLPGAWLLDPERHQDARGYFARTFCREELAQHGLEPDVAQCSTSFNRRRLTLRGMHWQRAPHAEDKLVRCTAGAVYDVIVDLRVGSSYRGRWYGVRLDAAQGRQLYVPRGFAHGFLTLEDDTEVAYQMSVPYAPSHAAGFRYDDAEIGIEWPAEPAVVSQNDLALPTWAEAQSAEEGP